MNYIEERAKLTDFIDNLDVIIKSNEVYTTTGTYGIDYEVNMHYKDPYINYLIPIREYLQQKLKELK